MKTVYIKNLSIIISVFLNIIILFVGCNNISNNENDSISSNGCLIDYKECEVVDKVDYPNDIRILYDDKVIIKKDKNYYLILSFTIFENKKVYISVSDYMPEYDEYSVYDLLEYPRYIDIGIDKAYYLGEVEDDIIEGLNNINCKESTNNKCPSNDNVTDISNIIAENIFTAGNDSEIKCIYNYQYNDELDDRLEEFEYNYYNKENQEVIEQICSNEYYDAFITMCTDYEKKTQDSNTFEKVNVKEDNYKNKSTEILHNLEFDGHVICDIRILMGYKNDDWEKMCSLVIFQDRKVFLCSYLHKRSIFSNPTFYYENNDIRYWRYMENTYYIGDIDEEFINEIEKINCSDKDIVENSEYKYTEDSITKTSNFMSACISVNYNDEKYIIYNPIRYPQIEGKGYEGDYIDYYIFYENDSTKSFLKYLFKTSFFDDYIQYIKDESSDYYDIDTGIGTEP